MARPEIANEESSRDLAVRQNPPCNYELHGVLILLVVVMVGLTAIFFLAA